jgi:tRNA threonylcarbamoyl adenosine modification protein YeaZ
VALLVEEALSEAGYGPGDIERVVVGAGPGSFTGLRIGYSFARGFAASRGIPLTGISSLRGAAWEFCAASDVIVPVLDARRGEVFMAAYSGERGSCREILKPQIVAAESCREFVGRHTASGARSLFVSCDPPAVGLSIDREPQHLAANLVAVWRADPALRNGTPLDFEPEYLRAVAAKTIAERRHPAGD